MGTGRALFRAMVTLECAEAVEICVEAAAPVTARAMTIARMTCFMMYYPESCIYRFMFSLDMADVANIGYSSAVSPT